MSFPSPTPAQARLIWFAITGLALASLVMLLVGLVWALVNVIQILAPVLWPLAVAGVIAYLLDPVVDFLEKKQIPRTRAIGLVFTLALLMIITLFGSIVPRIVYETRDLVLRVPAYAVKLQERVEVWLASDIFKKFFSQLGTGTNAPAATLDGTEVLVSTDAPPLSLTTTNLEAAPVLTTNAAWPATGPVTLSPGATNQQAAATVTWLTENLNLTNLQSATGAAAKLIPRIGSWLFGQVNRVASWVGVLAALALVPVYAFYFLLEKRRIASHWTDYLPVSDSAFKNELVFVLASINNYLIAFFRGQVLVAICDGILYGIGFMLVGVPYAALIGAAAVFLTIIPFIGAIIVCVSAVLISLVVHGDWLHPLLALGVVGVVQALEGLVISPKIMGDRVGLHPVTIIVAVMLGTTVLGGLLGGILAIPLTAALRVVMFRYVWKNREAQAAAGALNSSEGPPPAPAAPSG